MYWGYDPDFLEWEPEAIAVTPELIDALDVFVLTDGETTIGYYALERKTDGVRLDKLFVEPGRIGQGAGKRLWRHMVETARATGATSLDFFADPNAAPFYRAMGATWVEEVKTTRPGWNLQYFRYDLTLREG